MNVKDTVLYHLKATGPVSFNSCYAYVAEQATVNAEECDAFTATADALSELIREGKAFVYPGGSFDALYHHG